MRLLSALPNSPALARLQGTDPSASPSFGDMPRPGRSPACRSLCVIDCGLGELGVVPVRCLGEFARRVERPETPAETGAPQPDYAALGLDLAWMPLAPQPDFDALGLRLVWQPIFAAEARPGDPDAAPVRREALLRYQPPEGEAGHPHRLVGTLRFQGRLGALDEWVLRTACREAAAWADGAVASVNISPERFQAGSFAAFVAAALEETGLPPARLQIELTEDAILACEASAAAAIREVKALGVGVALDDFGVGQSSLGMLHALPIDKLKLDGCFARGIERDARLRAIVGAVVTMAHELGLGVCAEQVETEAQLETLRLLGCDEIQGFIFGRPGPVPAGPAAVTKP